MGNSLPPCYSVSVLESLLDGTQRIQPCKSVEPIYSGLLNKVLRYKLICIYADSQSNSNTASLNSGRLVADLTRCFNTARSTGAGMALGL